jgi:flagellar biogenesis protein FliO
LATNQAVKEERVRAGHDSNNSRSSGQQDEAVSEDETKSTEVATGPESQERAFYVWLGLAVFFCIVFVGAFVVRRILKSAHNNEVAFQGLQADQIVARITSKL